MVAANEFWTKKNANPNTIGKTNARKGLFLLKVVFMFISLIFQGNARCYPSEEIGTILSNTKKVFAGYEISASKVVFLL